MATRCGGVTSRQLSFFIPIDYTHTSGGASLNFLLQWLIYIGLTCGQARVNVGRCVISCFLDASKAFDTVKHSMLFTKLFPPPGYIVRLLLFWYAHQTTSLIPTFLLPPALPPSVPCSLPLSLPPSLRTLPPSLRPYLLPSSPSFPPSLHHPYSLLHPLPPPSSQLPPFQPPYSDLSPPSCLPPSPLSSLPSSCILPPFQHPYSYLPHPSLPPSLPPSLCPQKTAPPGWFWALKRPTTGCDGG